MMHACYLAACICLRPPAACVENLCCSTIPDFSILVLSPCVEQAYNKRFSQQHACYKTCSPFSPIMRRQKLIVKNRNEAIWAIKTILDGANKAGYRGHAQRPQRRRGLILLIRNVFCDNRKACAILTEGQKQEGHRTRSRSAHWRTWSASWRCWCSGNL